MSSGIENADQKAPATAKGLKGVMAADSSISMIDGTQGRLYYRGYSIDDLAAHSSYEETVYLLFNNELPTKQQLAEFTEELTAHRELPPEVLDFLKTLPSNTPPMSALRSAVSVAGIYDPHAEDDSLESTRIQAIRLTAILPTIVATIHRLRQGLEPIRSKPELSLAANFMCMLNGRVPTPDEAKAMDLILILHAEHGLNASTFAARVIIATLTDLYSSITGAIGALKGKLHGGANTEVLKTLMNVGSVENVGPWVEDVRACKGKFMGFGHAVYKTQDPRAKHLRELSQRLGEEQGDTRWYDISIEMHRQVTNAIGKECNVDFYSASLQHYMGIPGDLFTCVFATSRISGWCAHVLEQLSDNKIIRPSANYVGYDERPYVSIADRR
mgnify:FL=1